MKSLKLIGLALGASLALSTTALAQDISIAVAGPMTGGESAFGRQMKNGAEQAVADINAAGGVLGKKLALQIGDDACDPKQANAVAGKLASQKVALVAGHFCSGSSIPASKVYAEEGIIQISPASNRLKTKRLPGASAMPTTFAPVGTSASGSRVRASKMRIPPGL